MKKLILFLTLLIATPCYAFIFEVCDGNDKCYNFEIEKVSSIETISNPTYGVRINYKNGKHLDLESSTRAHATLMLMQAYEPWKDYYSWSDNHYYNVVEKQDKAHLGIH